MFKLLGSTSALEPSLLASSASGGHQTRAVMDSEGPGVQTSNFERTSQNHDLADEDDDPEADARALLASLVPFSTARAATPISTARSPRCARGSRGTRPSRPFCTTRPPSAAVLRPLRVLVLVLGTASAPASDLDASPSNAASPLGASLSSPRASPPPDGALQENTDTHETADTDTYAERHEDSAPLADATALPCPSPSRSPGRIGRPHVVHKLAFYGAVLAALASTPNLNAGTGTGALPAVADELERAAGVEGGVGHGARTGARIASSGGGGRVGATGGGGGRRRVG
ncbi:hypothetical protein B0H17DRAFT_1327443 [Mycena rosella]|uniref:Uncharacterized protein n=1 Tax=Mycena rosella TaxID=1033263 RepID=A0AAD7DYG4_MYCRO|nr:hypothetical protein B0H17DRAFT_1327443 [Mycena rosella]